MEKHTKPSQPKPSDPDEQAITFNKVSSARHVKLDVLLKEAFCEDADRPKSTDKPINN